MDNRTSKHYFLRAHAYPSMRNELPHNVKVILSVTSGAMIHAYCHPCKVAALGRCSHVVAVLFPLLDHVNKTDATLYSPYTSKECSLNKEKNREKDSKHLSCTEHPTKRKKRAVLVAYFDPRPAEYRQVRQQQINGFLRDLQSISSKSDEIFMWETQLMIINWMKLMWLC